MQEKINQPDQPGAFARLVVSIVRDLCFALLKIIQQTGVYIHFFSVITQVNKHQKDCFKLPLAHLGPIGKFSGKGGTHQRRHLIK